MRSSTWVGGAGRRLGCVCVLLGGIVSMLWAASPALAAAPSISEESALAGPNSAIIRAKIDPEGQQTHCYLQYVTEARYKTSGYANVPKLPCTTKEFEPGTGVLPAASEPLPVIAEVKGLANDTRYRFRFIAENAAHEEAVGTGGEFSTFGIETFESALSDAEHNPLTQAGGHPYEYTTTVAIDHGTMTTSPSGNVKDVKVHLPPGLIGDPAAVATCTRLQAETRECGGAAQVGTMYVEYGEEGGKQGTTVVEPLFNVVPPEGVAAAFSARFNGFTNAVIEAHVRTGEDYGIDADSLNITSFVDVRRVHIAMWGVPADARHATEHVCRGGEAGYEWKCTTELPETTVPFLSLPTHCTGHELTETAEADAWQAPGEYVSATAGLGTVTGCGQVQFHPELSVVPTSTSADSPTGLDVELKVPQNENPQELATADLKDASVTLPAGMTVNPAEASGLVGCPLLTGKEPAREAREAKDEVSGINLDTEFAANCPEASRIGKVTLETPLIKHPLPGWIYLAQQGNDGPAQGTNPFKSLLALYIAIDDPETGVVVKLAGQVHVDEKTGQLTTTFDENPQLPFENLKLEFFKGQRAPLATPMSCGTYQSASTFEPWSHEAPGEVGTPNVSLSPSFAITSSASGGACTAPGFTPALTAGTTDNRGDAFSPFTMTLTRKDGEQIFATVGVTLPQGLAGMVSQVPLCPEAQANAGDCPAASKIGHVLVQAGVGGEPITLPEAGKPEDPVYLTEKYEGAPFGLSIVVPAEAGPFNLDPGGRPIVVRSKIEVNPTTAQVSVVSNPLPTELQGIPFDIEAIEVDVNRPGFIFNPTSCAPMNVTGDIGSAEGAHATLSSRFQAAGCQGLPFHPRFGALTHAVHTRKHGEYLHVVVQTHPGQANIAKVHVQLPSKLPSELPTLKLACTEAQFDANPAGCPADSVVGTAIAHTPVLPVPLEGPAVFVSHGGKGFPNLDLVLQGDGVHITLVGDTYINKKQVTTSTFKTVPDVPVSRFDLVLPAGEHPALGGNGNMCAKPLYMPTTLTGQNGSVVKQRTKVMVAGCKPELRIRRHRVHGHRATIFLHVPSAGRLIATGKGLRRAAKRIKRHGGRAGITIRLGRHDRRVLARDRHERVNATIRLTFKPRHGKTLHAHVKVLIG